MECIYNHNGITCACATDGLAQCRYKPTMLPEVPGTMPDLSVVNWNDDDIRRTDLSRVGVDSITPEMKRADVSRIFEGVTVFDCGCTNAASECIVAACPRLHVNAGPAPQLGGRKDDSGKLPWQLVPWDAVRSIVKVLQFGAAKYAPRNWEKGMDWERPYAACIRHLTDWWERAPSDPETGFSHLFHAGCCILFLITYEIRGIGNDTRPMSSRKAEPSARSMHDLLSKVEKWNGATPFGLN